MAESRRITWDDTEIALLITGGEDGDYIVPAIVLDDEGRVMEGREVLEAIAQSGRPFEMPTIRGTDPGRLAELDQQIARVSEQLGVPVGLPDGRRAQQ